MSRQLFITNDKQRQMLEKLEPLKEQLAQLGKEADENNTYKAESLELLRSIGYSCLTLPTADGGEGFNVYDAIVVHERLASFDGAAALTVAWSLITVGDIFEYRYWSEDALTQFAATIANGAFTNRAASEMATGSPTRGGKMTSTAIKDGDEWVLNGRKSYTTGAYSLDEILVAVHVEEKNEMGFFLLPKNTTGMRIEENWDVLGMRGTGSHDLVLENVRISEAHLMDMASDRAAYPTNGWMLLISASYLGIAQAAYDYALHFAKNHSPNSLNGPISQLPHIKTALGEMALKLQQARYILYGVAQKYDAGIDRTLLTNEIGIAKYTVTNAAVEIVDKAMRVVGAKSLLMDSPLQMYYRNVRAGLHNPPMDDMTIAKLAEQALNEE